MLRLLSDIIKIAAKGSWGSESQFCSRVPKSLLDFPSMPDCKLRLLGLLDCQLCDRNSGITFFPVSGKPQVLVSSVRHTWHNFPQPRNLIFWISHGVNSLLGIYALHLWISLFHLQPFVSRILEKVLEEVFWQEKTYFYVLIVLQEIIGVREYPFKLMHILGCQVHSEFHS